MRHLYLTCVVLMISSNLFCQMEGYPLVEFSDFETRRIAEFTQACEEHDVKFIKFYSEIDNSKDFHDFMMPIVYLLDDSSFQVEVIEESNEYLAKISHKAASVIIHSRDKVYPHTSTIIDEVNSFLAETDVDKRLYLWPVLKQGTIIFAQYPDKLPAFHEAGGYDPTTLNVDIWRACLDILSGARTIISFNDSQSFGELNKSFVTSVNSLQEQMGKKVLSSDRLGLFKRSYTEQILLIINDQQLGHLSLDDNGAYTFCSGYTLLILREILLAPKVFRVKHISVTTKEEVTIEREVLLELIKSAIESQIEE